MKERRRQRLRGRVTSLQDTDAQQVNTIHCPMQAKQSQSHYTTDIKHYIVMIVEQGAMMTQTAVMNPNGPNMNKQQQTNDQNTSTTNDNDNDAKQ